MAREDATGWRTLEMITVSSNGMMLWVDSIEFLFISGIMLFLFISVRKSQAKYFKMSWARLGVFIGLLSIVDFGFSVVRFRNLHTYGVIEVSLRAFNRFFLYPIWLLWLSRQLGRAETAQAEDKANDDLELTENSTSSTVI